MFLKLFKIFFKQFFTQLIKTLKVWAMQFNEVQDQSFVKASTRLKETAHIIDAFLSFHLSTSNLLLLYRNWKKVKYRSWPWLIPFDASVSSIFYIYFLHCLYILHHPMHASDWRNSPSFSFSPFTFPRIQKTFKWNYERSQKLKEIHPFPH